jgi:hypothetical protein
MLVGTQQRKKRNSTKVNLLISTTFHAVIVGALLYLAAREGWLGKKVQNTIQVTFEKKEVKKEPEKPKEPPKAKVEEQKPPEPKTEQLAKLTVPKETIPPPSSAAPTVAPPAADAASFVFEGGHDVISTTNRAEIYKTLIQNALQFNWDRPKDVDDHTNVAEVEIAVDKNGNITDPVWKKHSGQKNWDETVIQAVHATQKVTERPPSNFPPRVVVRFDVAEAVPMSHQ